MNQPASLTAVNLPDSDSDDPFETMRVSKLWEKRDDRGLDLDGSRDMLIKRLKDDTGINKGISTDGS